MSPPAESERPRVPGGAGSRDLLVAGPKPILTHRCVQRFQDNLEQFLASLVLDALREASVTYWRRRAAELRWAQPRSHEFDGDATRGELTARWHALEEAAMACEEHAKLLASYDDPSDALGLDVVDVLQVWSAPAERRAAA
jgi:hypothetical protein